MKHFELDVYLRKCGHVVYRERIEGGGGGGGGDQIWAAFVAIVSGNPASFCRTFMSAFQCSHAVFEACRTGRVRCQRAVLSLEQCT